MKEKMLKALFEILPVLLIFVIVIVKVAFSGRKRTTQNLPKLKDRDDPDPTAPKGRLTDRVFNLLETLAYTENTVTKKPAARLSEPAEGESQSAEPPGYRSLGTPDFEPSMEVGLEDGTEPIPREAYRNGSSTAARSVPVFSQDPLVNGIVWAEILTRGGTRRGVPR